MEHPSCDACSERCEVCGLIQVSRRGQRTVRIVARSEAMKAVLRRTARFAPANAPVAILGESGTGKEVVARALHTSSPRAGAPFVAVNVAALPAELLESELFGHVRGAFTGATATKRGLFEAAEGGTLFLDEVGEMPLALQAKLLRALQDGEIRRVGDTHAFGVDVRVVCATHRDLGEQVARGAFRQDLLYRLKVLTLRVPPLRERREDILPLARMFLDEERGPKAHFTAPASRVLERYAWPGNVRELANAIKHGAALAPKGAVDEEHLPDELRAGPRARGGSPPRSASLPSLAEVEREHILRVLEACGGSQTETARVLGIGRNTLWRKLSQYA